MKHLFFVILITFITFQTYSLSQEGRPYPHCYPRDTACITSDYQYENMTFTYMGCNVIVHYKHYTYNCPTPITYIDIEYLRVSLTCSTLVCWLHPGPTPCEYNPLDVNNYNQFERDMYDKLITAIYENNPPLVNCPNTKTYRYYHISPCRHVCNYIVERPGPYGDYGMLYISEYCPSEGCCGVNFEVCTLNGVTIKSPTSLLPEQICPGGISPASNCFYQINQYIPIAGEQWKVIGLGSSNCTPACNE